MSFDQPSHSPSFPEIGEGKIEKPILLDIIKTYGLGYIRTKEVILKWTEQKEKEVVTSRDAILLNIERTDLYLAGGDTEGAIENLEDALTQADQENEIELQDQIITKIKEIKGE